MPINKDGKKYYSEEEIAVLRRDSDKNINGSLGKLITEVKVLTQRISLKEEQITKSVNRHENILVGNGKEGLVSQVSTIVKTQDSVTSELWNKEKGIQVRLDRICQRKKDYDDTVKKVQHIEIKVGIISAASVIFGAFLHKTWAGVVTLFGGNP